MSVRNKVIAAVLAAGVLTAVVSANVMTAVASQPAASPSSTAAAVAQENGKPAAVRQAAGCQLNISFERALRTSPMT